jgi:hypothetical protein
MPDVQNINLSKIIKRLELIKSLISLEEEDEIDIAVLTWNDTLLPTNLRT